MYFNGCTQGANTPGSSPIFRDDLILEFRQTNNKHITRALDDPQKKDLDPDPDPNL